MEPMCLGPQPSQCLLKADQEPPLDWVCGLFCPSGLRSPSDRSALGGLGFVHTVMGRCVEELARARVSDRLPV